MKEHMQDSPDELLRKLHQALTDVGEETEDGESPDDVFSAQTASKGHASADEDIAAFDTYMAQLLGEVVPDESEAPTPLNERTMAAEPDSEKDAVLLCEHGVHEEKDGEQHPSCVQETAREDVFDETVSEPDVRVELSDGSADEEDGAEREIAAAQDGEASPASFEVIEQLSIPQRNTEDAVGDDIIGEIRHDVIDELSDEPTDELSDELSDEHFDALDDAAFTQDVAALQADRAGLTEQNTADAQACDAAEDMAEQPEQDELPPVILREGDILLDEEDELPATPSKQPLTVLGTEQESGEKHSDEGSAIPVPVASPLDAVRAQADTAKTEEASAPRPKQSPLDAMAARTQGNVQAPSGIPAFGNRQSRERALTDDDVELLIDLGYAANLTQKVGSQRVEAIRYRRQDDEKARRRLRHVYGCAGEEYRSHEQDKHIKETYRRQTSSAVVRLVLGILLAFLMLLTDLLPMFADRLPAAIAGIPMSSAFGLTGIALLVLSVFVSWPLLERGFKGLMRFSPIPASMPVLLLIFTLLYDVITLFYGDCGILLNFPTGMSLIILTVAEIMTVQRERMTFEVVSAHSRKIVMHPISPRKKKVVRDGHIVKIINDDAGERAWRVHPTDQVAGYFRRSCEGTVRYRLLSTLLLCTVLSAFVVGLVTLIVTDAPRDAVTAFLLTVQVALPVSATVSFAYPMLFAARALAPRGCAIVGQSAVDEYAGEKTLVFDDTEMFRSKSSTEITIKGSGDNKKYIRYAKRLFRTLGGTLRGISTSDLSEETYEERVEILKIFERGVEARIDGKVNILMGTSSFMVQRGIRVPGESAELLVRRNVESSILYLAFDGKLRLGYEIDYRISGRFEQMAEELSRTGTAIAIETCDPSIQDDFLTRSRKVGQTPIAVVKPARFERHTESLLCDSGVVATRSARDIAEATAACDHLLENDAQLAAFHRVALVFGSVLVLALSLFGLMTRSVTVIAAALQAVWCIPTVLVTRKNLMNQQQSENQNVNRNRE